MTEGFGESVSLYSHVKRIGVGSPCYKEKGCVKVIKLSSDNGNRWVNLDEDLTRTIKMGKLCIFVSLSKDASYLAVGSPLIYHKCLCSYYKNIIVIF